MIDIRVGCQVDKDIIDSCLESFIDSIKVEGDHSGRETHLSRHA